MKIYSWLAVFGLTIGSCTFAQKNGEQNALSPKEFSNKLQQTSDAQLVDVRTPQEFAGGHLANAINMDYNGNSFETGIAHLDKNKPVFVYCLSGGRSHSAAEKLRKGGFGQVYEMQGGMMQWRATGLPENGNKTATANKELSLDAFRGKVSQGIVLVDFNAVWCGPCKQLAPIVDDVIKKQKGKVTLLKIDVDQNQDLAEALHIQEIPLLMVYKNGKLTWQNKGLVDEDAIQKQL